MKTSFTFALRRQSSPFCSFASIKTFIEQSREFLLRSPEQIFSLEPRESFEPIILTGSAVQVICCSRSEKLRGIQRGTKTLTKLVLCHIKGFSHRGGEKIVTRKAFSQPQRLSALLFSCRKL